MFLQICRIANIFHKIQLFIFISSKIHRYSNIPLPSISVRKWGHKMIHKTQENPKMVGSSKYKKCSPTSRGDNATRITRKLIRGSPREPADRNATERPPKKERRSAPNRRRRRCRGLQKSRNSFTRCKTKWGRSPLRKLSEKNPRKW